MSQSAIRLIREARQKQEEMKQRGKFTYTCADPEMSDGERYLVLGEEFGEVGRAVLEGQGLREELAQVAAVSLAWLEAIERAGS